LADVKIGVNADGSNVSKAIDQITHSVNDLARAVASAGKVKFQPVDVKTAERDLQILNKQFDQAVARSRSLRDALKTTGQTGRAIHDVDFSQLSVDPQAAQRMRNKAFGYSARGTAWDMGMFPPLPAVPPAPPPPANPPPPNPKNKPRRREHFFARAGRAFSGGVGGGVSQIVHGAINGAEDTGGGGGAMGLLRGGLIGAAMFGLFKAGQTVSEGYSMAKDRDIGLDNLKRQMGDLGVSFTGLKAMSDAASAGLGINSKEFTQLAEQYQGAAHGPFGQSPQSLMGDVQSSAGFARAYGIDPAKSVSFYGNLKNIDPRQNNRELALQIAEAINHSGGRAMAGDVMQFVQTMASSVARLSLSNPDTGAYATAFGSMLHGKSAGMTADNAQIILGQANSAVTNMGNAGEAGQNFTLASFNRNGYLNPFLASSLASGGLFASRGSIFNSQTEIGKYLRHNGIDPDVDGTVTGTNRDVTNFESLRTNLDRQYRDPLLKLDAAKNYFGLQSNQQAAALLNLDPHQASGLGNAIKRAGIDINQVNAGGMATLAAIGGAGNHTDLDAVYADILKRTGKDALTRDEKTTLDGAKSGDTEDFRAALIKIMASKDQQETEGSKLRATIKDLESVQTTIGDKMIGPMNTMRDALLKIAGKDGKSATAASLRKSAYDAERSDVDAGYDEQIGQVKAKALGQYNDLEAKRATLINPMTHTPYLRGQSREAVMKRVGDIDARMKAINGQRDTDIAALDKQRAIDKAAVNVREQQEKTAYDQAAKSTNIQQGGNTANLAVDNVTATPANDSVSAGVQGNPNGAIGERNNNPFDLRPWSKSQTNVAGGFLKFADLQTGVNAGFRNLLVAQDVHHRNTISQILSPYAPKKDKNDTKGYIDQVAKMTGFGKDEALNLHDPKVLKSLGKAILQRENVNNTVTDSQIDQGVLSALGGNPAKIADTQQASGAQSSVQDTLNVNVNVNTIGKSAQGATVQHNLQTSVAVPRGSGTQTVSL
jgi:hypothetical protein